MNPIFQTHLPHTPWSDPQSARLPGVAPLDIDDWLTVDEAFAGQMALRDELIAQKRDDVLMLNPSARPAADELLKLVLTQISGAPGYLVTAHSVRRPDGATVAIDPNDPLACAGRLVQEDLCIMLNQGGEHVLKGGILCFPASWTLREKFGRPLGAIHTPVASYDDNIARRVQRLFDLIQVETPLWRANALFYHDPTLHAPRLENAPRVRLPGPAPYVRSEKQCFLRLPESGAVVFSIHTYLVERRNLSPAQLQSLVGKN